MPTTEQAPWLGGATQGWAIATLAPAELFTLVGPGKIDTADGTFEVTPVEPGAPARAAPAATGAEAAREALSRLAREAEYRSWLRGQEKQLLATASCLNDQVPAAEATDLSPFVPFLFPRLGSALLVRSEDYMLAGPWPTALIDNDLTVLALVAERPAHGWALAAKLARGGEVGSDLGDQPADRLPRASTGSSARA